MRELLKKVFDRKSSIVNRQSSRPAAAIAFFFAAGIAASPLCRAYSFCTLAAAGILLACASFLALRRDRIALSLVAGLAAIAISGLLMALAQRDGYLQQRPALSACPAGILFERTHVV